MSERRGNRKRKSKITDEDEDSDFEDNNIKATRISTLSAEDHVCAQYILASLQKHKYADPFRYPVDTTVYFDYLDFVKQPMDFSTVQDKLNKHMYSYLDQFASEVRLIFSNCWAYNQPGSQVYNQASVLSQSFEKHLKKMRNQLKKVRDPEIEEMEQHIDQLRSEHDSLVRELQKLAKQHKRQTGNSTLNSNKKHSNRSQTASPISGSITHNINNNNNSNNNVSTPITSKKSREAINSTIHNNGNEINNSNNNNNNNNSNNTVTTPTQTSIKNNKLLLYEQTSDEYGYKDKERLSNKINRLSPDNQQKLLEVLANELPEDKDKNGGEVELDLNSLNDEILKKLELFVNEVLKQQEPTTIQVDSIINKEPDTDSSDSEEEEEDKKEDHDENPQII